MVTPFATIFLVFAFGLITGAYLPLALIYLVGFLRREHFGFAMVWKALVRLVIILVLLVLLFAALGLTMRLLGLKDLPDDASVGLGSGVLIGLAGGLILFVIGLIKGRRRTAVAQPHNA
jgi:hypothetical protein